MVRQAARRADAVAVEPSALGRKRSVSSRPTRGAFGVRSVVFAIGEMSSSARRRLAARFRSELGSVRALLKKAAEFLAPGAGGKSGLVTSSSSPPAAPCGGGKDGRLLVAGIQSGASSAVKAGGKKSAKKRKASFLLEWTDATKEMAPDGRKRISACLASLSAAEPPAQIGELWQSNRHGSSGKAEIEVHAIDDVALFELKKQLERCTEEARNHGHEPMDASAVIHPSPSPRQRQAADDKIGVEEEEDVDICGGASASATAPSPLFPDVDDYSELVGATGVKLLSPLQRKYIALAERSDVRGGASTVAPALSSLLPAGYSELVGATGVNLLSPLPPKHVALAELVETCGLVSPTVKMTSPSLPPGFGELADASETKMLSPLPRKYVALADRGVDVCGGVASTATTLPSLLPGHNELADAIGVKILSPLQHKYVALAEEDDEYVDICGDASPVIIQKNHGEIISNSSSSRSDSDSDSGSGSSRDSESDKSASGSTPALAIPTNACVSSAQPSSEPAAPEAVAKRAKREEKLPDQRAAAAMPSAKPLTDLIARAQGAAARRRQEEKAQSREKARQELLDMERTALATTSNVIHPLDMKLLGLAAVEYMVSTDEEVRRRTLSFDSTALRSASLLEKLGLFLKADESSDKVQQQQPSFVAGADDDVEEGEIR